MSYVNKKFAQYFCLCRIEDHLGSGQFGMVEKGVWYSPDGPVDVAIKTLKEESSEELTVMFLQEAAINGQFQHPNKIIVRLLGVVTLEEPVRIVDHSVLFFNAECSP